VVFESRITYSEEIPTPTPSTPAVVYQRVGRTEPTRSQTAESAASYPAVAPGFTKKELSTSTIQTDRIKVYAYKYDH